MPEQETKPYVYQEYPKMMYHPDKPPATVNSREEEDALEEPWSTEPHPKQGPPAPEEFGLDALTARVEALELRVAEIYRLVAAAPESDKSKKEKFPPLKSPSEHEVEKTPEPRNPTPKPEEKKAK